MDDFNFIHFSWKQKCVKTPKRRSSHWKKKMCLFCVSDHEQPFRAFFFFFEKRQYPWKRRSPGLHGKTSASLEKRRSSSVPLKTSIREYIDSQRFKIPCNLYLSTSTIARVKSEKKIHMNLFTRPQLWPLFDHVWLIATPLVLGEMRSIPTTVILFMYIVTCWFKSKALISYLQHIFKQKYHSEIEFSSQPQRKLIK